MNLVLLGAPGAGKGTQAESLAKVLRIPIISTGNMLREAIRTETETGKQAKALMDTGNFVPDELIISMVRERLSAPDCRGGYILDGVPRNLSQAQALESCGIHFDAVISLEVADAFIEARMTGRRVCPACGASFHISSHSPKREGVCDVCGERLVIRTDDAPETVKHRLTVYHEQTEALKDYYRRQGKLHLIAGERSIEEVSRDILKSLGMKR